MKVLISIVAVVSPPLIYGLLCVPLVGVLMSFQPDLVNDLGGTQDVTLTLQIETLQLLVLLLVGFVTAFIARARPMLHIAVAICLMLTIGLVVQLSFWDSMPVWHHFVFFASILIGLFAGGWSQINLALKPVTQMP